MTIYQGENPKHPTNNILFFLFDEQRPQVAWKIVNGWILIRIFKKIFRVKPTILSKWDGRQKQTHQPQPFCEDWATNNLSPWFCFLLVIHGRNPAPNEFLSLLGRLCSFFLGQFGPIFTYFQPQLAFLVSGRVLICQSSQPLQPDLCGDA